MDYARLCKCSEPKIDEVKLGWYSCTTITGLCETNVVMSTPEPETAKYMSNFLGEKEEISTNESISYGESVTLHSNCAALVHLAYIAQNLAE